MEGKVIVIGGEGASLQEAIVIMSKAGIEPRVLEQVRTAEHVDPFAPEPLRLDLLESKFGDYSSSNLKAPKARTNKTPRKKNRKRRK